MNERKDVEVSLMNDKDFKTMNKQEMLLLLKEIFSDMDKELSVKHKELSSSMLKIMNDKKIEAKDFNDQMDNLMKELGDVTNFMFNLSKIRRVLFHRVRVEYER